MTDNTKNRIWALLALLALLGTLVVNTLANTLPINGITTGEVSARYPNLFVPAGFTFSIWGLIYLLLALYVGFQLVTAFRKQASGPSFIHKSAPWFILSSLANMGWILAWHHGLIGWSVPVMLVLLTSLVILYQRLQIGISPAGSAERYMVHLPFSIYLGWITVATIANVAAWLVSISWNGWGLDPLIWTSLMVLVAGVVGLRMLYGRKDLWFNLVLLWAIGGIIAKQTQTGGKNSDGLIIITAFIALNLIVNAIIRIVKKRVY